MDYTIGIILAVVVPILSYCKKAFTVCATIIAVALLLIIALISPTCLYLIVITFLLLGIVEKCFKKRRIGVSIEKKSGPRDSVQLLANGVPALLCVVLYWIFKQELFIAGYIAALAEAFGDSIASSIGPVTKTKSFDIRTLKEVVPGTSGGISVIGSLSCIAGCIIIALIAYITRLITIRLAILAAAAAVIGCFIDSYLGSAIQVKYQCPICKRIIEKEVHCGTETRCYSGKRLVNNDTVNAISNFSSALFSVFLACLSIVQLFILIQAIAFFLFSLYIASAIHEIGHLIGCLVTKCTIKSLCIKPFHFIREPKLLKLTLRQKNHCSFYSIIPKKAIICYAFGPATNVVFCTVFLVLAFLTKEHMHFYYPFALANFVKFIFNLIPNKTNDGAMIKSLYKEGH